MNLAPVIDLLERRIGLDAMSLGASALPAAVGDEMRALGLSDATAYAGRLAGDADAFAALVERLVVPETWFFRGAGLFEELARVVARSSPGARRGSTRPPGHAAPASAPRDSDRGSRGALRALRVGHQSRRL